MKVIIRGRRGFCILGHDPTGIIRTRHIGGIVDVLSFGAQKLDSANATSRRRVLRLCPRQSGRSRA